MTCLQLSLFIGQLAVNNYLGEPVDAHQVPKQWREEVTADVAALPDLPMSVARERVIDGVRIKWLDKCRSSKQHTLNERKEMRNEHL